MRVLMNVRFPHREFNAAVKEGSAGKTLNRILEDANPEAVYFTEQNGQRAVVLVIDVNDPSQVPSFAEPWFLGFNADVEFKVAMTADDLKRSGLDDLGKKWS
jgi:hypothetical protein